MAAFDPCHNIRSYLGEYRLGHILEVGSKGSMVTYNMAYLCNCAAPQALNRLEGQKSRHPLNPGICHGYIYLFRRHLTLERNSRFLNKSPIAVASCLNYADFSHRS